MKHKAFIYIGSRFYDESNTMMSSVYEDETWKRSDWGLIQTLLSQGVPVYIRPANEGEMQLAERFLNDHKADKALEQTKW